MSQVLRDASEASACQEMSPRRIHLGFLDGLRGLSALYVMLFHLTEESVKHLSANLAFLVGWLRYGHFGVDVFIVLSGYCLMLPVVSRTTERGGIPGGLAAFFQRRAWRILPTYYAALLFSMLLVGLSTHGLRALAHPSHLRLSDLIAVPSSGNLITHLLLVYNWNKYWCYAFNYPLWSVAVEWQIYFIFALLLIPLWRRYGIAVAALVAIAMGVLPHYFFPQSRNLDWSLPWMLGIFAIGMTAAVIGARLTDDAKTPRRFVLAGLVSGLVSWIIVETVPNDAYLSVAWIADTCCGIAVACLILHAHHRVRLGSGSRSRIVRALQARPLLFLGAMSYSLYLVHKPLLIKFSPIDTVLVRKLHLSGDQNYLIYLALAVPATILLAYVFHLCFERPFLKQREQKARWRLTSGKETVSSGADVR